MKADGNLQVPAEIKHKYMASFRILPITRQDPEVFFDREGLLDYRFA